jgi:hypothetical protein
MALGKLGVVNSAASAENLACTSPRCTVQVLDLLSMSAFAITVAGRLTANCGTVSRQ